MKRALATIVLAVLPLSVVSVPAFARADEPSAIDAENALQAYKDGKTLRDKGDLAASLEAQGGGREHVIAPWRRSAT